MLHRMGSIRASGCLLAVRRSDGWVRFASANIDQLLDVPAEHLLGRPLSDWFDYALASRLVADARALRSGRRTWHRYTWSGRNPWLRSTLVSPVEDSDLALFEVPFLDDPVVEATQRFHEVVDLTALETLEDIDLLMDEVARRVRIFTGYARAMVYLFEEDGSGRVAAESVREGVPRYLGLHYPASDIPPQARRLFVRNRVRIIEDTRATNVAILGDDSEDDELDLSHSLLRSVAPTHLEYLENMGARASLAISLVHEGALWGMIACHDPEPRALAPTPLLLTECLSGAMSLIGQRTMRAGDAQERERCRSRIEAVLDAGTVSPDSTSLSATGIIEPARQGLGADGAALVVRKVVARCGTTPSDELLERLTAWLRHHAPDERLFHTHHSAVDLVGLEASDQLPAGLLALRYETIPGSWLLFFRNEQLATVTWAGNPDEPVRRDDEGRIGPRTSFEKWSTLVRGKARPWSPAELDCALYFDRLVRWRSDGFAAPHYPAMADGNLEPTIRVTVQGLIVDWNAAVETRLGWMDLRRRHVAKMLPWVDSLKDPRVLEDAARGKVTVREHEYPATPPRLFEVTLSPSESDKEVLVTLQDISERKRVEQQLLEVRRMETVASLSSGLAHNFKNLLTIIDNAASMALAHVGPDHHAFEELETIRSVCDDAAQLVRDFASVARPTESSRASLDVNRRLRELERLLRSSIPPRIEVHLDLAPGILGATISSSEFEQLVLNLVLNARDAIEGSGHITLRTRSITLDAPDPRTGLQPGPHILLEVEDDGSGIPSRLRDRIFTPFFTTKATSGGSGLGLASCQGIVRSRGGHIDVQSSLGRGTRFTVYLPDHQPVAEAPTEPPPPATLARRTILLVEDEPTLRNLLARALRRKEFEVLEVVDGTAALELLESPKAQSIDALVSDQRMPGISGSELARRSRGLDRELPIVLMSGEVTEEESRTAEDIVFLQKPFKVERLVSILAELLSGDRSANAP